MKYLSIFTTCMILLALGIPGSVAAGDFSFQGHLSSADQPVTGVVDLTFELFDDPSDGDQVGPTLEVEAVAVNDGLFTVVLNFGPNVFADGPRWLRISVEGSPLSPRQAVTPSPQALHAGTVSQVDDSALGGTYTEELAFTNPGNEFVGQFAGEGAGLTGLDAGNVVSGVLDNARTTGTAANVANTLVMRDGDGNFSVATMNAVSLAVSGNIAAGSFSGNGSALANLDANRLTTGTLPQARLSGTYLNALNFANANNFFTGNGVGLSNLNANNIKVGTLAEGRLPSSVLSRLPDTVVRLSLKGSTSAAALNDHRSVAMSNNLAVVLGGFPAKLQLFDVADPSGPSLLGSVETQDQSLAFAVSGSHAYVISTVPIGTLRPFEISDPSNPSSAPGGVSFLNSTFTSVAATESHVFVTGIFFGSPTLFRFSITASGGVQSAGSVSGIASQPLAVAASGELAYVINSGAAPVLQIFNASDPGVLGSVPIRPSSLSVAVSGGHAYVVSSNNPATLEVFDVSDPANPVLVGDVATASTPTSVAVSGHHVYVAHGTGGGVLRVYDASDPSNPLWVDFTNTFTAARSVAVSDGYASVGGSNLTVFRTATPLFNGNGSGLTSLNAGNIATGNLNIARLPAGGNWSLSSLLNIASNTLVANPANSRVGISTSTPDSRLHVAGGSTASLTTGSGFLQVGPTNAANLLMDGGRIIARDNGATGLMRINTTGLRVGSGTDPFGTLHVEATDGGIEGVGFRVRFDGNTRVRVTSNGGTSLGANADAPDNGLRVAGETYLLGNVGVATSAPGAFNLAVNGSAAKTGGGSWASFSDERLKHDIQPLAAGVLDRVLSLNGYTFQYHDKAVEKKLALPGVQTGLIAQEVAEVFPDWVDADDEGYLFVTERGTTALFVEAMRELRQEKDAEIAELRAEKEELARRLERLETFFLVAERQ